MSDNINVEDGLFIDDVAGRAKHMIEQLRKGWDAGTHCQSAIQPASEFLAQRLGDVPAEEQR